MIVLPTNLKDDDYEGRKKWEQIINNDGSSSYNDVTQYKTMGDQIGALEMNKIHAAIMGFTSCETDMSHYNADKYILETDAWGKKKKTTFNEDGTIYEALYDGNNTFLGGKTTTFAEKGSRIIEEVQMV